MTNDMSKLARSFAEWFVVSTSAAHIVCAVLRSGIPQLFVVQEVNKRASEKPRLMTGTTWQPAATCGEAECSEDEPDVASLDGNASEDLVSEAEEDDTEEEDDAEEENEVLLP